jgi:hypothetical protein
MTIVPDGARAGRIESPPKSAKRSSVVGDASTAEQFVTRSVTTTWMREPRASQRFVPAPAPAPAPVVPIPVPMPVPAPPPAAGPPVRAFPPVKKLNDCTSVIAENIGWTVIRT